MTRAETGAGGARASLGGIVVAGALTAFAACEQPAAGTPQVPDEADLTARRSLLPARRGYLLKDESFERGLLPVVRTALPRPKSTGHWSAKANARLTSQDSVAGDVSLEVNTLSTRSNGYAYQDFAGPASCDFVLSFSVKALNGRATANFLTDWNRGRGGSTPVSRLYFAEDRTEFTAWRGATATLEPLSLDEWHLIEVISRRAYGIQLLFVDGRLKAEVTSTPSLTSANGTVILGDGRGSPRRGWYRFDDVQLLTLGDCK